MRKYFIQAMMTNLEAWIELESHSMFKDLYIKYYDLLNRQQNS